MQSGTTGEERTRGSGSCRPGPAVAVCRQRRCSRGQPAGHAIVMPDRRQEKSAQGFSNPKAGKNQLGCASGARSLRSISDDRRRACPSATPAAPWPSLTADMRACWAPAGM